MNGEVQPGHVEHIAFSRWVDMPGGGLAGVWHTPLGEAILVAPDALRSMMAADLALNRGRRRSIEPSRETGAVVVGSSATEEEVSG